MKKRAKFHEAGTNRKKVMSGELKVGRRRRRKKKKKHLLDAIWPNFAKS